MRPDLPDPPPRIARLPVDRRGYPVPRFVVWIDGKPDFRIVDPGHLVRCVKQNRCWICGEQMGRYGTFVIGPMCAVNLISSEPPSHLSCATWAARACPFLADPSRSRGEANKPDGTQAPAGIMLRRNPGVVLLWTQVRSAWHAVPAPRPDGTPGVLFHIGRRPESVAWLREGRPATRAEVLASIDSGMPHLRELDDGDPKALAELDRAYQDALLWAPAA